MISLFLVHYQIEISLLLQIKQIWAFVYVGHIIWVSAHIQERENQWKLKFGISTSFNDVPPKIWLVFYAWYQLNDKN